jgi:hypothetical protein
MTITAESPSRAGGGEPARCHTWARPGFANPEAARDSAIVFTAAGLTAQEIRGGAHPGDMLLAELADAMDLLASEGMTPQRCRDLAGGAP